MLTGPPPKFNGTRDIVRAALSESLEAGLERPLTGPPGFGTAAGFKKDGAPRFGYGACGLFPCGNPPLPGTTVRGNVHWPPTFQ